MGKAADKSITTTSIANDQFGVKAIRRNNVNKKLTNPIRVIGSEVEDGGLFIISISNKFSIVQLYFRRLSINLNPIDLQGTTGTIPASLVPHKISISEGLTVVGL
jgi:hypothetical protein